MFDEAHYLVDRVLLYSDRWFLINRIFVQFHNFVRTMNTDITETIKFKRPSLKQRPSCREKEVWKIFAIWSDKSVKNKIANFSIFR